MQEKTRNFCPLSSNMNINILIIKVNNIQNFSANYFLCRPFVHKLRSSSWICRNKCRIPWLWRLTSI